MGAPGAEDGAELGNTLTEDARWLVDFVRGTGGAVVASNSGTGAPESAYVLVAATDAGKIVFGTNAQSLKFTNITSDPRVSMVLVQDGAHEVQLEGEARRGGVWSRRGPRRSRSASR